MFYAAKFFSGSHNSAKMLQNVARVYTIDLEITLRNYLLRKLKYDPAKGTMFAKKGHFGQGSGEIGNFVEPVTLYYHNVTSLSDF